MGQPLTARTASGRLHIVVTCSNRKTRKVPPQLHLGVVPGSTPTARRQWWTGRLSIPHLPAQAARDTYAGEHWSIATTLPDLHAGPGGARLWVASAGYGLIPAEAPIMPYSATFAAGHADSVIGPSITADEWWQELSTWPGPMPGASRTIAALAATDPDATFLLVLSPPYLRACRQDILTAAEKINDSERLMVVSVGAERSGPIADLLVRADGRLQGLFGGSKLSINVRVAAHMIKAGALARSAASAALTELARTQPAPVVFSRQPLSDAEVTAYISQSLAADPKASATRLLRTLRDSQLACEQHRFHRLYRDLVGGAHGHAR
ncbi:hypothetical protein HC031_14175 [Planosporangium thailandense]|uniref:Uncharacterized protein n=1 Tax=Planosporangium thailandense TaxID=765197 RepID=A0ABX0XZU9_9ACTN|nr:hypothetical protein [Planosporangium thailandense]NJC70855.1 hypothetical protein [Planosporangium thailandense]